jgi:hypothetical protein
VLLAVGEGCDEGGAVNKKAGKSSSRHGHTGRGLARRVG